MHGKWGIMGHGGALSTYLGMDHHFICTAYMYTHVETAWRIQNNQVLPSKRWSLLCAYAEGTDCRSPRHILLAPVSNCTYGMSQTWPTRRFAARTAGKDPTIITLRHCPTLTAILQWEVASYNTITSTKHVLEHNIASDNVTLMHLIPHIPPLVSTRCAGHGYSR